MGFAFDEATGLPVIVEPQGTEQRQTPPPLMLHLQPEPVESPETEIGDIMLRVQRFADETAEEAKRKARSVIADAQVEAATIVARARREAEEIAAQFTGPVAAPESVTNLCSAIEEFSNTNKVLVDELVQLRQTLAGSYSETPIAPSREVSVLPPLAG
jgi:regulator of protease activity HflC (stomatin/prohibitin superfamily)